MPQEQQNIRRWLVRLTGPIFIEMVLIILLGIVDTVMLSQCSDNTVAAVGVVVQLLNMIFLVFELRQLYVQVRSSSGRARWTTYSAPSAYRWPSI
ncbi:MAG: MATE family efflux transporter [Bilophila wadsworthia]